ncbi:unnamed protein product [Callosobruchus maculatus]|uniref:Saposin B-type domain-containing protein n=1 Tax=Callosobruchus maculatus TaxID=64391 RepID=A0A653CPW2_CALMS|nr:unnamed protein product [Callosobruchus maculatus]
MYFAWVCVLVAFTVSAACEDPFDASAASRATCSGSDQVCLKLNVQSSNELRKQLTVFLDRLLSTHAAHQYSFHYCKKW